MVVYYPKQESARKWQHVSLDRQDEVDCHNGSPGMPGVLRGNWSFERQAGYKAEKLVLEGRWQALKSVGQPTSKYADVAY